MVHICSRGPFGRFRSLSKTEGVHMVGRELMGCRCLLQGAMQIDRAVWAIRNSLSLIKSSSLTVDCPRQRCANQDQEEEPSNKVSLVEVTNN